jgi:hypothetical protein
MTTIFCGLCTTILLGTFRFRKSPYREVCLLDQNFPEGWTTDRIDGAVAMNDTNKSRRTTGMGQHTATVFDAIG